MSWTDIDSYRVRCISPIQLLDYFSRLGVEKEELLRDVQTDRDFISKPHNWIPLPDFLTILQNCSRAYPFLTLDDWEKIGAQIGTGVTAGLFRSIVSLFGIRMSFIFSHRHIQRFNNFSSIRLLQLRRESADFIIKLDPPVANQSMGIFTRWAAGLLSALPAVYHHQPARTRILYDQALLKNICEKLYGVHRLNYTECDSLVYIRGRIVGKRVQLQEKSLHPKPVFDEGYSTDPPYNATVITEDVIENGSCLLKKGDIFDAPYGRICLNWREMSLPARWMMMIRDFSPMARERRSLFERQIELADRRYFEAEKLRREEAAARKKLQELNEQYRKKIVSLHQTKAALRKSEEKYREILADIEDGYFEVDLAGNLTVVNASMCRILGYGEEELIGMNNRRFMDAENAKKVFHIFNTVYRTGIPTKAFDWRLIRKDSGMCWIETSVTLIRDAAGNPVGFRGILRDITERKQAEAHLLRSERMAALGDLVAGVAHEISTPLGVGVMSASFLKDTTEAYLRQPEAVEPETAEMKKYARIALEASTLILTNLQRAAELLNSFKQVAVDQSGGEKRRINLKGYLMEVLNSLRPKYKRSGHSIQVDCPEDLEINTHPGAFSQIITNLVMNSLVHAFEEDRKGEIRITVSRNTDTLLFHYRDDGKGMKPQVLEKIFEPFFTTKRGQGGSGLGMHVVYNLVTQKLNGRIECSSQPGKGAEFLITLPLS
ncbi:MAG: PAS domain S-box protein [Thermodesulfobacteriota bacterium]